MKIAAVGVVGWVVLLFFACSSSKHRTDTTQVLSPGNGVANAAPLDPLQGGSRFWLYDGKVRTIGNAYVHSALTRRRVVTGDVLNPQVDVSSRDDGIWLDYSAADGVLESSYLLVPASVKVGMKWITGGGGHKLYTYEVVSRTIEDTIFQKDSIVWQIDQTNESDGIVQRQYAEGIGFLGFARDDLLMPHKAAIVPLSAVDYPAEPMIEPTVSLNEINITDYDWSRFVVDDISVVTPTETGLPQMVIQGRKGGYVNGAYGSIPQNHCLQVRSNTVTEVDFHHFLEGSLDTHYEGVNCPSTYANGFAHPWDGAQRTLFIDGTTHWFKETDAVVQRSAGAEIFRDTSYRAQDRNGGMDSMAFPEDNTGWHPLVRGWSLLDNQSLFTRDLVWPFDTQHLNHNTFALFSEGQVALSVYDADFLQVPVPVGFVDGQVTAHAFSGGKELLAVTGDGRVDLLTEENGNLKRTRLMQVQLPEGHFAVAAFRSGDYTYVMTHAAATDDEIATLGPAALGATHFFITDTYSVEDETISLCPSGGVTAGFSMNDLLVCWPPSDAPLQTDDWTLGEVPVHSVVSVNDHCALLLRDIAQSPAYQKETQLSLPPYWGTARVTLPGLGEYIISAPFDLENDIPFMNDIAPVQSGELTSLSHLFSSGALCLGKNRYALDDQTSVSAIPDPGENGLWTLFNQNVTLFNEDSIQFQVGSSSMVKAVGRQGQVFVTSPTSATIISADGTVQNASLPAAVSANALGRWLLLDDGKLCGSVATDSGFDFACYNNEAESLRVIAVDIANLYAPGWDSNQMVSLEATTFLPGEVLLAKLLTDGDHQIPLRIDLDTGEVALYPTPANSFPDGIWYGANQTVWAVSADPENESGDMTVLALHTQGAVAVPFVPALRSALQDPPGPFLLEKAHVFDTYALLLGCFDVLNVTCSSSWYRVPRPQTGSWRQDDLNAECEPESCTAFSSCVFDDTCTTVGSRSRVCFESVRNGEECVITSFSESEQCVRETDGLGCGTACTEWSDCVSNTLCSATGSQMRQCSPGTCSGGVCMPGVSGGTDEQRMCAVDVVEASPCGQGGICTNNTCVEISCMDGVDDDEDSLIDCMDLDCEYLSCDPDNASSQCMGGFCF